MGEEFYEAAMAANWVFHIRAGIDEHKTDFKEKSSVSVAFRRGTVSSHTSQDSFVWKLYVSPIFLNILSYLLFLDKLPIPLPLNYLFLFLRRTDDKNTNYQRR